MSEKEERKSEFLKMSLEECMDPVYSYLMISPEYYFYDFSPILVECVLTVDCVTLYCYSILFCDNQDKRCVERSLVSER